MTENNQTNLSNQGYLMEENNLKQLIEGMTVEQKEVFKNKLAESLGAFSKKQANFARQIIYDDEQQPLEAEYQERLKGVPRGNVGAVTRLQTEMSRKGWRGGKLQADREQSTRPPTQEKQEKNAALMAQYRAEVAQHRGNLRRVSKIQQKFRAKGLNL